MPRTTPDPDAGARTAGPWLVLALAVSWVAVWSTAAYLVTPKRLERVAVVPKAGRPGYAVVAETRVPWALRLEDGRTVRPADLAAPATLDAADAVQAAVESLLEACGQRVYVEPVPAAVETNGTGLAALVWLPPAGGAAARWYPHPEMTLLAAELVGRGLARVADDGPGLYREELAMVEHEARRHGRGLWGASARPTADPAAGADSESR